MKSLKIASAISITILITGCVPHWTQTQCTTTDLNQQGLMDGRAGMSSDRFTKYQTDCNRFKITLSHAKYSQGWRIGNRQYCQPTNLYNLGRGGSAYPVVCNSSPAQRNAYSRGHQKFTKIQALKSRIASIDNQLNKTEMLRNQYENTIAKIAQDRANIENYRHPVNDDQRNQLNQARADLAAQRINARMQHAQLIASQDVDLATPEHRIALMHEKARLENQLAKLQS